MTRQQTNRTKIDRSKTRSDTPNTRSLFGGKLDESDWNELLDDEEVEQIASEYVHDLLNLVLEKAYKSYLSKQLIPFTVYQASEAILKLTELEFIEIDPGDCITSPTCLEDKVPPPCKIDSWAQGAMSKRCELPVLQSTRTTENAKVIVTSTENVPHKEPSTLENLTEKPRKNRAKVDASKKSEKSIPEKMGRTSDHLEPKNEKSADSKSSRHPSTVNQLDENTKTEADVTAKKKVTQPRRFAGSERFTFDDEGNLVGVPRLVSTPTKANRANKQTVLHEQPADRLGSIADTVITAGVYPKKASVPVVPDIQQLKRAQNVKIMATGLFSVLDQIEPMPGVSVTDGERTRTGPGDEKQCVNDLETHKLDGLKEIGRMEDTDKLLTPASRVCAEQILKLDAIQIRDSEKAQKIS
ncbi:hypothetical protein FGIG_02974 [Fasciola gigantica]|uniref:Uncharacterized protein n=1 Tax=Fasciola gigantica TaxID=46835 RepID=A0A504WUX6_FASGI|nr:hypothetical protein FGIG_02974 [Fasciola gigantica]